MSFPLYKKERERRFRAFPSDSNPADTSATVPPCRHLGDGATLQTPRRRCHPADTSATVPQIGMKFCVMVEL